MSLLKRIEQGQTSNNNQPPAANSGGGGPQDQASKLAELRMRRAAPPSPGMTGSGGSGGVDLKSGAEQARPGVRHFGQPA